MNKPTPEELRDTLRSKNTNELLIIIIGLLVTPQEDRRSLLLYDILNLG
jgi:hypothetical protein